MDLQLLQAAVNRLKESLEYSIRTATATTLTHGTKTYPDGLGAKEALIRSAALINEVHEVTKRSLVETLTARQRTHTIFPPLGKTSPELALSGLIKAKKQDLVVLLDGAEPTQEPISGGALDGAMDRVGLDISEKSIVVGVRSQLSSVDNNFDTLMERTFAETLNLRLRLPELVMGEVYLLPVREYDNGAMKSNQVAFSNHWTKVEKFIKTFRAISGRQDCYEIRDSYKYERSTLVLVDFEADPPEIFLDLEPLQDMGAISEDSNLSEDDFETISPRNFASDLVAIHEERHPEA